MFTMTIFVISYMMSINIMRVLTYVTFKIFKDRKILNTGVPILILFVINYIIILFGVTCLPIISLMKTQYNMTMYNLYTMPAINTLKLTASNCTECSPLNISCTSSAYNISYQKDVDYSVQCLFDTNISSYNSTLTVESEIIDWSVMVRINLFWLHVICMYCFIYCLIVCARKDSIYGIQN